ncbi:IclR family transcriptional regulator [Dactylosporangium salmoneum]|uniref:IclR family transcriptional regulator n=1 Tax=Dactylosporangium salmoneum TaxID=53361 RepID=A0ABP5T8R2_9ACTN
MPRTTAAPGVTVASRLLGILGSFDPEHRVLTLSELARRAGLTLPTAHRLVGELVAWGALRRTPADGYAIGRRLWDLGLLAPAETALREVASPFLQDLYAATRVTVHLAVREGDQVLYLDRLSGNASLPIISTIGSRLPIHTTGVGKVLLAHAPATVCAEVLGRPLPRATPYTVTSPARLRQQLDRVLSDGFATTGEEMTLGAYSIAVPVAAGDRTVAALGVVVPNLRGRARLLPAMRVAAHGIGRALAAAAYDPERTCG